MTTTPLRTAGSSGLHVRYEKAGLLFDVMPIPWNADAVVVEANLRASSAPRVKSEFTLRLSTGTEIIDAELLRQDKKMMRVFFRIPIPPATCTAQVFWREHELGHVDVPMTTAIEFTQGLTLHLPALHVNLNGFTVACQTFVSTQCQSLCAVAQLTSVGPLAPIVDLDLHVEVRDSDGERVAEVPVHFTSGQLRARQTLLSVFLPRLRRAGEFTVTWLLGKRSLHAGSVRVISKKKFLSSLRISATRFVVQKENGEISVVRWLPHHDGELRLEGIARVSPCFFVCSSQPGMAGVVSCTVQAVAEDKTALALTVDHEMLVTDGPMPLLGGTIPAADLPRLKHFALDTSAGRLGVLPPVPAPTVDFTAEGSFAPLDDFLWSPAAEEQLNDRLGKLLNDG